MVGYSAVSSAAETAVRSAALSAARSAASTVCLWVVSLVVLLVVLLAGDLALRLAVCSVARMDAPLAGSLVGEMADVWDFRTVVCSVVVSVECSAV